MNRTQLIAAAVLSLAGSAAFAQSEIDLQYFGQNQASSVARSEVRADIAKSRAAGELTAPSEVLASAVSTKAVGLTRAQVQAEVLTARGSLATPTEVAMFQNKATGPVRSREAVAAEAREFAKNAGQYRVEAGY